MNFKLGDQVRVIKSPYTSITVGTCGTIVGISLDGSTLDVSIPMLSFYPSFNNTEIELANPLPYSGQQLTFTPLAPGFNFDNQPVVCSCGPKFQEDPHKKECGMKDKPAVKAP